MSILILGASGRTGRLVVNEALNRGLAIKCLVRNKSNVPFDTGSPNIEIVEGNPTNIKDLKQALTGCNQVISALNVSRTSDFPWSKLRSPKDLMSQTVKNLILLSREIPIKKLVVCSAWGVGETRKDIPKWFGWLIENSNIKPAYDDHKKQEQLLNSSNLSWVCVRPVGLMNGSTKQEVKVSINNEPKPSLTINRITIAHYLLDALDNDSLIYMCPTISGL